VHPSQFIPGQPAIHPPVQQQPVEEVIDDWKEHTDKKTGRKYYHSKVSLFYFYFYSFYFLILFILSCGYFEEFFRRAPRVASIFFLD
jgi:hypothetical protein